MRQKRAKFLLRYLSKLPYLLILTSLLVAFATVGGGSCGNISGRDEPTVKHTGWGLVKADYTESVKEGHWEWGAGSSILLSAAAALLLLFYSCLKRRRPNLAVTGYRAWVEAALAIYLLFLILMIPLFYLFRTFEPHAGYFMKIAGWALVYMICLLRGILLARVFHKRKQTAVRRQSPWLRIDFIISLGYLVLLVVLLVSSILDGDATNTATNLLTLLLLIAFLLPQAAVSFFLRDIFPVNKAKAILLLTGRFLLLILFGLTLLLQQYYLPAVGLLVFLLLI